MTNRIATMRVPKVIASSVPTTIEDGYHEEIQFHRETPVIFDRRAAPDPDWVLFALTCATSIPLAVIANMVSHHLLKGDGKIEEVSKEEIRIEKPDGTIVQIKLQKNKKS